MTDLFTYALSRQTDPPTSHAAAAEVAVKLSELQERVMSVALPDVPRTASEIAQKCVNRFDGLQESYRKRCRELVRLGYLREQGAAVCSVTGNGRLLL